MLMCVFQKDLLIETQQKQIERCVCVFMCVKFITTVFHAYSNVKTNLVAQWAESLDEV